MNIDISDTIYNEYHKYDNYNEYSCFDIFWGQIYFSEKFVNITDSTIPGIFPWYKISNYGKIFNKYTGEKIKIYLFGSKRYYSVNLKTIDGIKSFMLHRLIMSSFYPEKGNYYTNMDINHKDGNGFNNYISYNNPENGNIEWMSHKDNIIHAYKTGLHKIVSKINEYEAKQIIELLAQNKYTSKQIVEIVGGNSTIHIVDDIRKKQCWNYLSEGYEFYQKPWRQFTEEDIHNFCRYFQEHKEEKEKSGMGIKDHCRACLVANGFEPSDRYVETLRKIYKKKYYKHVIIQYDF